MAQFARPSSDVEVGASWIVSGGGSSNLWAAIDEASASESDFITDQTGSGAYETLLSSVGDPVSSSGHVVRYRASKENSASGRQVDLTVWLLQGATTIASWTEVNLGVWSTFTHTLTGTQADAISDYANLRLEFNGLDVGGGSRKAVWVSWAELEVPDAGDPPVVAGQSSESDSATVVSRRKLRAVGQSAESDSATAVVRRKSRAVGQVAASESATAVARGKSLTLGLASESDSAGSASAPAPVVVGVAVESGSATLVGRVKSAGLAAAVESGSVFGLDRVKSAGLAAADESDSALAVGSEQPVALGQAVESGSATAVARSKAVGVAGALESGSALVVSRVKAAAVAGAVETGSAGAWLRVKSTTLGQAGSAESSQPVSTSAGPVLVGLATESALVAPVERSKLAVLASAGELDTAEGVVVPGSAVPRPRVVGLVAVSGRLGLSVAVSGRLGASVDQIAVLAAVSGRLGGSAASSGRLGVSAVVGGRLACSAAANRVSGSVDYM